MSHVMLGRCIDKVFVSVYMSLQRRTQTLQNLGPVTEGSRPCFECSGTLLCGRDLKCHIELQTECSLVTMAASAMFEFVIDSELEPPRFRLSSM